MTTPDDRETLEASALGGELESLRQYITAVPTENLRKILLAEHAYVVRLILTDLDAARAAGRAEGWDEGLRAATAFLQHRGFDETA